MPKGSHLDSEHQKRAAAKPRHRGPDGAGASKDDAWVEQYQKARTAEKIEGARMKRLKREKLSGSLVEREEADGTMRAIVAAIRSSLSRVTGFLPSDLTPTERARCETALRAAVQRALADAATQLQNSIDKLSPEE